MAHRFATSDVLYTAMTERGVRDVRLSDLMTHAPKKLSTDQEVVDEFVVRLQEVYDLLPNIATEDRHAQLEAALSSKALSRIQTIIPSLPRDLRPLRSDSGSIINIAMCLAIQIMSASPLDHS